MCCVLYIYSHNASWYGVKDQISTLHADAYDIITQLEQGTLVADLILLAPPWGGMHYLKHKTYDIRSMISSGDGIDLIQRVSTVVKNIIYLLPRNIANGQINEMRLCTGMHCRVDNVFLYKKCKMVVLYFGDLFKSKKSQL